MPMESPGFFVMGNGASAPKGTGASSVHESAARWLSSRHRIRMISTLALIGSLTLNGGLFGPPVAAASPAITNSNGQGFDGCQLRNSQGNVQQPTASQMQAFWTGTPEYEYSVYIGGSTAYCPGPTAGISQSWFTSVLSQGWGIVGLWVGPQCCGTESSTVISTNTTNAYNQGVSEADKAANQWCNWGQCYGLAEPIAYDFESDTNPTAQHAFLRGWTHELQSRLFSAGGYSSTCLTSNEIGSWASLSPVVNFIYPAYYDGRDTVYGTPALGCLANSVWVYDQRFHQYQGTHSKTYNNVTLSIDSDCANGPVLNSIGLSYGDSESSEGAGPTEDPNCVS